MKKLLVTLGLCATVFSTLAATAPVNAAPAEPAAMEAIAAPIPQNLQLRVIAPYHLQFPGLFRAELTSQLWLLPTNVPHIKTLYCLVRNTGLRGSGPFKTLIRLYRPGFPVYQIYVPMNIPAGGHQWVIFRVYAPRGITRVFSYADATYVVPEYNESNNWDSIP